MGKSDICDLVILISPKVAVTLPLVWLKAVKVFPAPAVPVILPSNAFIAVDISEEVAAPTSAAVKTTSPVFVLTLVTGAPGGLAQLNTEPLVVKYFPEFPACEGSGA